MTKFLQNPWPVAVLALIIVALAIAGGSGALALKKNVLTEVVPSLLAGLVAIAAITERATAVINDIWFGPTRLKAEDDVRLVNRKVNETVANAANARVVMTEAVRTGNVAALTANATVLEATPVADHAGEIKNADEALTAVKIQETRARLSLSFIIALIVSAVGVRTFAALFELGPAPANQVTMLGVVDIVLTAGMLAGGTAGISAISELLGTYVTASRKRALENP